MSNSIPSSLTDLLRSLIGQTVTIGLVGGRTVNGRLTALADGFALVGTSGGTDYILLAFITDVATGTTTATGMGGATITGVGGLTPTV